MPKKPADDLRVLVLFYSTLSVYLLFSRFQVDNGIISLRYTIYVVYILYISTILPSNKKERTRFYLVISQMGNEVQNLCTYLEYVRYSSPETIRKYKFYLTSFFLWLQMQGIKEKSQIRLSDIERYKQHLTECNEDPTVYKAISCIRGYFVYLDKVDKKYLHYEVIENIKRPYQNTYFMQ